MLSTDPVDKHGAGRVSLFWQLPTPALPGLVGGGWAGAPGTPPWFWPVAHGEITLDQQQVCKIEETVSLIFPRRYL